MEMQRCGREDAFIPSVYIFFFLLQSTSEKCQYKCMIVQINIGKPCCQTVNFIHWFYRYFPCESLRLNCWIAFASLWGSSLWTEDSFRIFLPCSTADVGSWLAREIGGVHSVRAACRTNISVHTADFLTESARTLPGGFPALQLLSKHRPQSHRWVLSNAILINCVSQETQQQHANGKPLLYLPILSKL